MRRAWLLGCLPAVVVHLGLRFGGLERLWVVVGVYHALCVVGPALGGTSGAELRLSGRWIAAAVALGLALGLGIWTVGRAVHARGWLGPEARGFALQLEPWWLFVVYSLAVNAFLEEWFWRGFLLPRTGVAGNGVLYGLMHFAGLLAVLAPLDALLLSVPTLVAGLSWAWLRRVSGSLWPCILTHLGADAGILALAQVVRAS